MSVPINNRPHTPRIDFGWIGRAWGLFTARMGVWIGAAALYLLAAGLIAALIAVPSGFWGYILDVYRSVAAASSGAVPPRLDPHAELLHLLPFSTLMALVNGILYGGLYRTALRQARGEPISALGVFSAFDVALPLVVVALVLAAVDEALGLLVPSFGGLFSILVQGVFVFAPLLIVDRRMGPIQALTENLALLNGQRWMGIIFYFVVALMAGLGALLCGVGILATLPLLFLTLGIGYLTLTGQIPPVQSGYPPPVYGQPEPGVWPPPPTV